MNEIVYVTVDCLVENRWIEIDQQPGKLVDTTAQVAATLEQRGRGFVVSNLQRWLDRLPNAPEAEQIKLTAFLNAVLQDMPHWWQTPEYRQLVYGLHIPDCFNGWTVGHGYF